MPFIAILDYYLWLIVFEDEFHGLFVLQVNDSDTGDRFLGCFYYTVNDLNYKMYLFHQKYI